MRYFLLMLAVLALCCIVASLEKVLAHDIYQNWHPPLNPGTSCCNNSDCRPTRAYLGNDGLWRALIDGRWLTVPREVVLPTDYAKDGRSHVCEKEGHFYCFTPGEVRG